MEIVWHSSDNIVALLMYVIAIIVLNKLYYLLADDRYIDYEERNAVSNTTLRYRL